MTTSSRRMYRGQGPQLAPKFRQRALLSCMTGAEQEIASGPPALGRCYTPCVSLEYRRILFVMSDSGTPPIAIVKKKNHHSYIIRKREAYRGDTFVNSIHRLSLLPSNPKPPPHCSASRSDPSCPATSVASRHRTPPPLITVRCTLPGSCSCEVLGVRAGWSRLPTQRPAQPPACLGPVPPAAPSLGGRRRLRWWVMTSPLP